MDSLIKRLEFLYKEITPPLEGHKGQIGLVKASGASKSVVNQWLSGGIKTIKIKYALAIEKDLKVSHTWLMTGKGAFLVSDEHLAIPDQDATQRLTLATLEELDLLHLFRLSNETGRLAILAAAKRSRKRAVDDVLIDQK